MGEGGTGLLGVILAGGRARRMAGRDKAWVLHEGRPLILQVHERLAPQVDAIIINANRGLDRYRDLGWEVISDPARDRDEGGGTEGPLAGMAAVAARLASEGRTCDLLFVPCDGPALAPDLALRLRQAAGADQVAVAHCDGRWQPLFCLIPHAVQPGLIHAFAWGERSPERFFRRTGAIVVEFQNSGQFLNINQEVGT